MRVRSDLSPSLLASSTIAFNSSNGTALPNRGASFRKNAGGGARLDHVGAVLDLITHGRAHLVWTISDACFDSRIEHCRAKTVVVTVSTAYLSEFRRDDSRTFGPAFVDRFAQSEVIKLLAPTLRTVVK